MGLLDYFGNMNEDQAQSLMAAASQILQGAGNPNRPFGLGQAAGVGMDAYQAQAAAIRQRKQQEAEQAQMQQMRAMQLEALRQQEAEKQRISNFWANAGQFVRSPEQQAASLPGGPTIENARQIPNMQGGLDVNGLYRSMIQSGSPELAAKGITSMVKPDEEAYTLKPGEIRFKGGKQVASVAAKPDMPNSVQEYQYAVGQGYKGTFTQFENDRRRAGATNVSLSNVGPRAFEGELGKLDAEQLGKWRDAAQIAQTTVGIANNLRSAEEKGAYSGGGANLRLGVANLINGITGATPKGLVGSQLYNAEASKLVLERVKALGANPSNADREFIERTVPMLGTSPEARRLMVNYIEQKAQQAVRLYQRADQYSRKNYGLGGFNMLEESATPDADALVKKYLGGQ